MGLGPLAAIYQARFNRYLAAPRHQGHVEQPRLGVPRRRRDRRARGARRAVDRRARGARQPDLRRQLQPAAPRRPGARQRQDHPGARVGLPRRRLERDQGHLGPRVGRAARARRRRRPRRQDERDARRRVPEVLASRRGAYIREHFFGTDPRLKELVAHMSDDEIKPAAPRRPRLPQGLRRVRRRDQGARPADRDPGQDGQGLDAGHRRRGAQHHAPGQEADRAGAARSSATGCELPIPDAKLKDAPYYHPGRDAPEIQYLHRAPRALGGPMPRRVVVTKTLELPGDTVYGEFMAGSGTQEASTTMAFAKLLRNLLRDKEHRRAHRADHPRRGAHVRHGPALQGGRHLLRAGPAVRPGRLEPGAVATARRTDGQVLEEGITEAGSSASFQAAGTATRRTASR